MNGGNLHIWEPHLTAMEVDHSPLKKEDCKVDSVSVCTNPSTSQLHQEIELEFKYEEDSHVSQAKENVDGFFLSDDSIKKELEQSEEKMEGCKSEIDIDEKCIDIIREPKQEICDTEALDEFSLIKHKKIMKMDDEDNGPEIKQEMCDAEISNGFSLAKHEEIMLKDDEDNGKMYEENVDATCTPPEVREQAQKINDQLLPQKSKNIYLKTYSDLKSWCQSMNVEKVSENILIVYFQEQAQKKKASSLWAIFSMLKSTISLNENIDISKYFKLVAFLKRQNTNYKPKKSLVFTKEEIDRFIELAPDETFLSTKVVLIIAVAGACRTDELCNFLLKDLDVRDDIIIVNIRTSKNGSSRKFVIVDHVWLQILKKYIRNRPIPDLPKLFIKFRGNKPTRQHIGHNTISKMPKVIGVYLNLPEADKYTGHTFRRTSATLLAESGGDLLTLKQHGGWKSSAVAEGYIEESLNSKKRIASMVQGTRASTLSDEAISNSQYFDSLGPLTSSIPTEVPTRPIVTPGNSQVIPDMCFHDEVINIPVKNQTNTAGPGVFNMTYNNCTINYYVNNRN